MAIDSLRPSGLDTLSERALRRLTDRWTGELYSADSVETISYNEAATTETFNSIVERWQRARELYHDAAVEDVMGAGSSLADGVMSADVAMSADVVTQNDLMAEQMMHSTTWWNPAAWGAEQYNLLIAALFIYYIFCLYRYFDDVRALLSTVFRREVVVSGRTAERRRSDIFYGSLGKLFMLGACLVGVIVAGVMMRFGADLPREVMFYAPFAGVGIFLIVILVQNLLLALIGVVTRSVSDVASLLRIRLIYFVLATLLAAPMLMIATIVQEQTYNLWFDVGCVAIGIAVILFVRESIGFFISKKVSILHWILYLCTVEIMPLTLLWQAAKSLR